MAPHEDHSTRVMNFLVSGNPACLFVPQLVVWLQPKLNENMEKPNFPWLEDLRAFETARVWLVSRYIIAANRGHVGTITHVLRAKRFKTQIDE